MSMIHCDVCDKDFKKEYFKFHVKGQKHIEKANGTYVKREGYYKYDTIFCESCDSNINYYSYKKHLNSSIHERKKVSYLEMKRIDEEIKGLKDYETIKNIITDDNRDEIKRIIQHLTK